MSIVSLLEIDRVDSITPTHTTVKTARQAKAAVQFSGQEARLAIENCQPGFDSRDTTSTSQSGRLPPRIDKLIAVTKQWRAAVEHCQCKFVRLYDGWYVVYAAVGRSYCILFVCLFHLRR